MTVDTFGSLTFIVETNADNKRSKNHSSEKSFLDFKHSHAKGIEAKYTVNRYQRDLLGSSWKRTCQHPFRGEHYHLKTTEENTNLYVFPSVLALIVAVV